MAPTIGKKGNNFRQIVNYWRRKGELVKIFDTCKKDDR